VRLKALAQVSEELAEELRHQYRNGKQIFGIAGEPLTLRGKAAAGHDEVQAQISSLHLAGLCFISVFSSLTTSGSNVPLGRLSSIVRQSPSGPPERMNAFPLAYRFILEYQRNGKTHIKPSFANQTKHLERRPTS